jgi:hypothetical protein
MQKHLENIKTLIDIAVQKGVFQDANSVLAISESFNEIVKKIQSTENGINNTTN